jgi:hypothetical protein
MNPFERQIVRAADNLGLKFDLFSLAFLSDKMLPNEGI